MRDVHVLKCLRRRWPSYRINVRNGRFATWRVYEKFRRRKRKTNTDRAISPVPSSIVEISENKIARNYSAHNCVVKAMIHSAVLPSVSGVCAGLVRFYQYTRSAHIAMPTNYDSVRITHEPNTRKYDIRARTSPIYS